jgi:hypothetical protein
MPQCSYAKPGIRGIVQQGLAHQGQLRGQNSHGIAGLRNPPTMPPPLLVEKGIVY